MAQKDTKTNVMRTLERLGIPYTPREFPVGDRVPDGVQMASLLGLPADRVFKTLVTRGSDRQCYVFVIPVAETLDLKKAAAAAGVKSVAMLHQNELLPETGYIHGGCSPIGMRRHFDTYFAEEIILYDTVTVSAGKVGCMVEVESQALLRAAQGVAADLIVEESHHG